MNRRQFLRALALPFVASVTACSSRLKDSPRPSRQLAQGGDDDYQRELSRQVYPKIRDLRIPLDMEVLSFNPSIGGFERTVIRRVYLHPSLKPDGILAWAPEG
jgi:hypothetical protein